ncbi:MAG: hypothetical protein BGO01_13755 [Armatimonadetes bacterium 55-13]|nr:hypothetical protein [Armatimonadota bacterium]OJU64791.1 MAG: hypothetical protein BGO01_13755 [Armatimonadetes bacterium 55-13]
MREPLAKPATLKPEETFARSYVDRLILEKLTEMEAAVKLSELADKLSGDGIGLAAVRSLLASNPDRFAYHERRWIPASRLMGVGRPLNEQIAIVLHGFGGPMPLNLLVAEIARLRRDEPETVEASIRRIAEVDIRFVLDIEDRLSLTSWGFVASDEKTERAYALNQITAEDVDEVAKKLEGFDWTKPNAVAEAITKVAPVSLKALGAVAWGVLNPQDPRSVHEYDARDFYSDAVTTEGYIFAPDGVIYPEAESKKWVSTAIKLADRLAPTVELDDAAPIEVKAEDVDRLVNKILGSEPSTTATRLLEEFYEITPSNKTFPDDMANLMASLRGDARVTWVGGDRFQKAGQIADFVNEVPEPFKFVPSGVLDEEGEPIDIELTDDGLSSSLRKLLSHPLATDVLDEDILPAPKTMPESVRLVLKSIHRELGTFPLCQLPTGWLDAEPKIQELIFIDPNGRELQVWVNQEARLMFGLIEWWFDQPIESGGVFTLTKTTKPNVLEFAWMDQPDPVVYISSQRMEELRQIGARADGMSTLDILVEVMGHWPKGADYLTILAEVNVVRRSSRRLVASLLSSYQCFYQRSGSPVWHYDAKKLDQGFDKTKKKFIKK